MPVDTLIAHVGVHDAVAVAEADLAEFERDAVPAGDGALRPDGRHGWRLRRAELLAVLSLGTDLGLGQPMQHVLRPTVIALRLADRLVMPDVDRACLYYTALLARGLSTPEIARELVVVRKTARNHVQNIDTKAGISNRAQASLLAVRHGLACDGVAGWG